MSARSLGVLTLDLVAKIGGFTSNMQQAENQAKTSLSRIEQHADKASQGIRDFIGTAAGMVTVGAVFNKFIENTRATEQEQAQLAAALKSTGQAAGYNQDQLNEMANSLSGSMTMLSGGEINQAQTTLLAFTGIVGKEFPRALEAAINMSARTGMSVVSAAETIGRSLDVPSQGLAALSKQGFRFTEDQKKLAERLESTGHKAEAQGIILEALEESYGGAATAARDTFNGSLAVLGNTVNDLTTGDGSLSGLTTVINTLNDALGSDDSKEFIELLAGTGAAAGIGYLTGGVIALTKSTIANIVATREKIVTDGAALEATRASTGAALLQARTTAAATAAEVRLAEAQLASATTEIERRAGMVLLTEARLADTAATRASTVAQDAHNRAMVASRISAGGVLGVLTGPVGLAVMLGLTAASFLMLHDSSDKAVESLDVQGESVDELTKKYRALNAEQQLAVKTEVSKKLEDEQAQLSALAMSMASYQATFEEGFSEAKAKAIENYFVSVKQGGESANNALAALQATKAFSPEQLAEIAKYGQNYKDAATKVGELQQKMDGLEGKLPSTTKAINGQATAFNSVASAAGAASEALVEYFDKLDQSKKSTLIETALLGKGFSTEVSKRITEAEMLAREKGMHITSAQAQSIMDAVSAEQQRNKLVEKSNEAEKKRTEQLKKQAEFVQVNARTLALSSKHDFAATERKYGLPDKMLTGLVDQESRGNVNARSPAGAHGAFQFMPDTAKRFKLANPFDVDQAKEAAGKYLSWLFDRYKDWGKALTAYHSGEGNVDKGNIGPIGKEYAKGVMGRMASAKGAKFTPGVDIDFKDYIEGQADQLKALAELAAKREQLEYQLSGELEKITSDRNKKLDEIDQAFFDDPATKTRLLAKVNDQFEVEKAGIEQRKLQTELAMDEMALSEEQLIERRLAITQKGFDAQAGLEQTERQKLKDAARKAADDELAYVKLHNDQELLSAKQAYMSETEYSLKHYALVQREIDLTRGKSEQYLQAMQTANKMAVFAAQNAAASKVGGIYQQHTQAAYQHADPQGAARFNLQNQYESDDAGLNSAYLGNQEAINNDPVLDQQEKEQALLDAHKQYLEAKAALDEEYAERENDLRISQNELALSGGESLFGSLTDIAATTAGKQSAIYKTMFAVEKGFAIAKSVMAIQTAMASAAMALPFPYNLGAMATVAANVAGIVSNIQSVRMVGQAHDGIMEVPDSGTWNLQKGERVLPQKTAAKLDRTLEDVKGSRSLTGGVTINITNNVSNADVSTRQNPDGSVSVDVVDKMIKSSWRNLSDPNSFESKQTQRNTTARPNR